VADNGGRRIRACGNGLLVGLSVGRVMVLSVMKRTMACILDGVDACCPAQ
jgi:hypothetical protein